METTEILTGGSEVIDRIAAEWTELCEEGASSEPFLRPEWFFVFVTNFEKEIELVTVRRNGKLRAVLPLVRKKGSLHGIPVRKLQAVYNLNTQRFDLIHGADETEREAITKAIWKAIKGGAKWDVIEIRLVKTDSWLGDVLRHAEREGYASGRWQMDSAPFITLPSTNDADRTIATFLKTSRRHLRQQLDRRLRRLNEIGKVEFVVTRDYVAEQQETYFDLETKGWKGRQGTAVTDDPAVVKLHQEFVKAEAERNALFAYELRLDGKTIAMSINLKYDQKMIHWKTSYDEEYAKYSPGNILFRELVKDCLNSGLHEIDLLSPATTNKKYWASGEREHVAFYLFRPGFIGSLLWGWKFLIMTRLRGLKARTPRKLLFMLH